MNRISAKVAPQIQNIYHRIGFTMINLSLEDSDFRCGSLIASNLTPRNINGGPCLSTTSPTSKVDGKVKTKEKSKKKTFEPRILAFCCNWCSYAGADLAGTSRMQMPPNVRIIRVNCTGRIDVSFILDALYQGADGVLISGCHPGDCHYTSGNLKMQSRFALLENLLDEAGFEVERVHLQWASAAEGDVFAEGITSMVERVKKLGPNPVRAGD